MDGWCAPRISLTRSRARRLVSLVAHTADSPFEKAGDLPVQQSTRIELIVNMKAAKALGIDVPTSILLRADDVIE